MTIQSAARHAECVFTTSAFPHAVAKRVRKIREAAVEQGRNANDIKVVMSVSVVVAETDELRQSTRTTRVDIEDNLVKLTGYININLSKSKPQDTLKDLPTDGIQAALENITVGNPNRKWTVAGIANSLDREGIAG